MALPFQLTWANGNPNKRVPTDEERSNGHACGPADPDLEDYLKSSHEVAINNLARQLTFAASQVGKGYDPAGEDQINAILTSYADIIKTDMAISVPDDYPTIVDAMEYLSNFRIIKGVQIVISVAANTYNHGFRIVPGHPDGDRILVQGEPLPLGMVTESDFATTGYDAGSRNADRVTNDSMLRSRFPTKIICSSDGVNVGGEKIKLKNLLFIGAGTGNGIVASEGGSIECDSSVSAHYFNYGMLTEDGGFIDAKMCTSSASQISAVTTSRNGVIIMDNGVLAGNASGGQTSFGGTLGFIGGTSKGNGGAGLSASFAGAIQALSATCKNNLVAGFAVSNGGIIQAKQSSATNNSLYGYYVNGAGVINAIESVATGQTTAYRAEESGYIEATSVGGNITYSPAKNTIGNGNAYIKG